ncbi:MAG: ribosomal protein S18-alanine N-acetyltransferase [Chitinophagaceae bacterium]|nr:ribosomal protein S18-alanine N-acetyltransferase [Rubrivivax sp.]
MGMRDVDAVMAVENRAYSHPWTRGNFIDSLAAGYLAEVLETVPPGAAPFAMPVLGYFIAMPGADELHLLNLTVHPDVHGQGLGQGLLDTVQDRGRQRGLAMLWLEVRESNHRARALYRWRGFSEVGKRRGYYPAAAGREDAIVMSLPLAPGGPDALV